MCIVLLAACWLGWKWWLKPQWLEDAGLSYSPSNISGGGRYGANVRPKFTDMLYMKVLDKELVPSTGKGRLVGEDGERRLIVVGDVHGCKDERMHPYQVLALRYL
jgi:hypothetical protein